MPSSSADGRVPEKRRPVRIVTLIPRAFSFLIAVDVLVVRLAVVIEERAVEIDREELVRSGAGRRRARRASDQCDRARSLRCARCSDSPQPTRLRRPSAYRSPVVLPCDVRARVEIRNAESGADHATALLDEGGP